MYLDKGLDDQQLSFAAHEALHVSNRDRLNIYIMLEHHGFVVHGEERESGVHIEQRVSFEAAKSASASPLILAIEQIALKLRNHRAAYNRYEGKVL